MASGYHFHNTLNRFPLPGSPILLNNSRVQSITGAQLACSCFSRQQRGRCRSGPLKLPSCDLFAPFSFFLPTQTLLTSRFQQPPALTTFNLAKECDQPRDISTSTMAGCRQGHISKECDHLRDMSTGTCRNCDQQGHLARSVLFPGIVSHLLFTLSGSQLIVLCCREQGSVL